MSTPIRPPYRGRFAPSPSGPLHFGSLIAAVGSYLDARAAHGAWYVRIEDIDPPREVAGAADHILNTLDCYGFQWDGPVTYQSRHTTRYESALERLDHDNHLYACQCSRREIARTAEPGINGPLYPGTCRDLAWPFERGSAYRLKTDGAVTQFSDRLFGKLVCSLEAEVGDFVLRRADGLFAYQLAVVIDDAEQAITDVVRGADLLDVTHGQIHLFGLLDLPTPRFLHLPLAVDQDGGKLSKQQGALAIPTDDPRPHLLRALQFLGQRPPAALRDSSLDTLWHWAITHWNTARLPQSRTINVSSGEVLP